MATDVPAGDPCEPVTTLVRFDATRTAVAVRVNAEADLTLTMEALRLGSRPVVAVVGGAGNLDERQLQDLTAVFADVLAPVIRDHGAAAVDGGTDSGVMRLLGHARVGVGAAFPLVGVAAVGTVRLPGEEAVGPDTYPLEPGHSHFVLVPGADWGDEAPWLARVATALAGTAPSVTVLVNGGEIALRDVACSIAEDRPVVVLKGTGRTADRIAAAATGASEDPRAMDLAGSPLVHVVAADDLAALIAALEALLTR